MVFVNPDALKKRRMEPLDEGFIKDSFGENNLVYAQAKGELESFLNNARKGGDVILMMSSGNFGGLVMEELL